MTACEKSICVPINRIIKYDTYEDHQLPALRWLYMFVQQADLLTAIEIAHLKFFEYSRYGNTADTIVPLGIPWTVFTPLTFEISTRDYVVYISLPAGIVDPPAPTDPSVQIHKTPIVEAYVRTFTEITDGYQDLIDEFKRDLENDNRSFNNTGVYINFLNTNGLMQIVIVK